MAAVAVAKGLYIGPQSAIDQVEELGITHVLSVVNYEVAPPEGVCHWQVHLEDAESANLLAELPAAVTWLERAMRQKGCKVLVHCNAGTSRSPSVVLAAIMKAKGLALTQALEVLRARAPDVSPNPGFIAQLDLWGDMRYQVDEAHPAYKQFLLDQVAAQWEEEGWVDPSSFAQLPEGQEALAQLTRYRCRKCRQVLFTDNNVIPQTGVGQRIFRRQRHHHQQQQHQQQQQPVSHDPVHSITTTTSSSSVTSGLEQGSVFCEPMWWMQDQVIGPVQGKLYCINCNARLGSFNWAGITNSSGTWMIPGFQIHSSRLDVMTAKPPVALSGIRFPAALAKHKQLPPAEAEAAGGSEPSMQQQQEQQVDFLPDLGAEQQWQQLPQFLADPQGLEGQQQQPGCEAPGGCANGHCCQPHQQQQQPLANDLQQLSIVSQHAHQQQSNHSAAAATAAGLGFSTSDGATKPWFQYLVLDCDGVLVDTEAASCESLRRAILEVTGVDIPHDFPTDYTEVFGMDVISCIRHYKHKLGRADWVDVAATASAVQAAKEGHYQQLTAAGIKALPGAAALIQQAKALGMPVCVGSSGAPSKIQHNLTSSGLSPLLDPKFIVSATEVRAGKPAPDVYCEVLRRLGCEDASRAVVVEDAVHGLVAAKAAGAYAIGITNSLPAVVLSKHADLVLSSLEQLDLATLNPTAASSAPAVLVATTNTTVSSTVPAL